MTGVAEEKLGADARSALTRAAGTETARIVSTLIRITGNWDLAEECVQEAFARAVADWPARGVPANPGAWLTTVAKNRAIDLLRRSATEANALREVAALRSLEAVGAPADVDTADRPIDDDRLSLVFTCCHPALAMEARIALTLRTVAGLTTAEIARAFLVPEATMAKRLVRARAKIRDAGIPYRVPPARLLPSRAEGVLVVVYLLFTEGYSATGAGSLTRDPLAWEAIRLGRLLTELLAEADGASPELAEARGLLALMLFQQSRSASRTDDRGDLVTLEEQDRSTWDAGLIAEAVVVLRAAGLALHGADARPGPYRLQAEIARCHATASDVGSTDVARIARLYDALAAASPSPVVELNRAVAVGMSRGPLAGLALLDELAQSGALDGYYLLPAARADFLRRLGRRTEAHSDYRRARDLAPSEAERRYLDRRMDETAPPPTQPHDEEETP